MLLRFRNRIINTDQIIEARYSVSRKRAGDLWLSDLFMNKPARDPNNIIITKYSDGNRLNYALTWAKLKPSS